jgi:hypothetical protein
VSVLNGDAIAMIKGVQLHVAFLRDGQYILQQRLLKWVGEQSSRRDIAAHEDPHAEIAGITPSGQHYLSLWGLVDGRAHPGHFVPHPVPPGDYIAEITITSDRKPVTQWVHVACT